MGVPHTPVPDCALKGGTQHRELPAFSLADAPPVVLPSYLQVTKYPTSSQSVT
jgi:hypothetical protein